MTKEELLDFKERNEVRKKLKEKTTPGPWYINLLDDNQAMNLVAVSTVPDTRTQARWLDFDQRNIIAVTLIQSPHYADIADQHWEENAEFISFSRNDTVEADVDTLIEIIEQLLK